MNTENFQIVGKVAVKKAAALRVVMPCLIIATQKRAGRLP